MTYAPGVLRLVLPAAIASLGVACSEAETLSRQGPELAIDAERVEFGDVPIGASERVRLSVANRGRQVLRIEEIVVAAPFTARLEATELAPGAAGAVTVEFSPERAEEETATLSLSSNASAEPTEVALRGRGVQSILRGFPEVLDFGSVRLQESVSREIVLTTNTVAPVEGRVIMDGFAREEHWELTFVPRFGEPSPFALAGLDEQILTLTYRPFSEGIDDGNLLFEMCGEGCGVWVDVEARAVTSALRIEPAVVDFGEVGIDGSSTEQLVVSNIGDTPFGVRAVRIEGSDELSFSSDAGLPVTIQPNGFITLRVTYAPFAARELTASLVVETDQPEIGARTVELRGRGAGPRFEVLPEVLQFGVVDERPSRRVLLLANSGSSAVRVETLELAGDPAFRLADPPPMPIRLGPGDTSLIDVELEPDRIGVYTATVTVTADDPALARALVPVRAFRGDRLCRLDPQPQGLNFGVVSPGLSREATITFRNEGTEACVVQSVGLREPADPFFAAVPEIELESIEPGGALPVRVRFAPTEDRDAKAALVIRTNDPLVPRRTVNLVGTGLTYADIFVQPESIDLGALRPMCNRGARDVTLFNAGDASVEVVGVDLVPPVPEATVAGPVPVRLEGGDSSSWTVSWRPSTPGSISTDVVLSFSELPFPLRVPVTGLASFDARSTDLFEQRDLAQVDVLFVIDDSCSMQDDQQDLAANADTFIRQADLQEVRYRIGVTTTSEWPDQGRLVGPVIDRDRLSRDEVIDEFRRQARVGIGGSGIEEGMASAVEALDKAKRGSAPNRDLLRPDASVALIVVTDEDDSSPASMVTYYRELRFLVPNELVTAVVSGGPDGCGTAIPTPRYQRLLDLTGGQHISICDDWGENLEELGQAAFAPRDRFTLRAVPEPTLAIVVRVDGELVPPSEWTLPPGSDTLVFDDPPPPKSRIEVSYVPRCQ